MRYGIRFALVVFACLLTLPLEVYAGGRCYSPAEVEAEQVIRLHSELMVITVTCHYSSQGQDLVRAYTDFTRVNIRQLHDAEQTMAAYYKKAYGGNGVDRLDRLRTLLANEYGQEIASSSAPAFCAERRDKVVQLSGAAPEALRAAFLQVTGRTYDPICGQVVRKGR
jgi:hypothetical protein